MIFHNITFSRFTEWNIFLIVPLKNTYGFKRGKESKALLISSPFFSFVYLFWLEDLCLSLPSFSQCIVSLFLIQPASKAFSKPLPWLLNAAEQNHTARGKSSLSRASSASSSPRPWCTPLTSGSRALIRSPGFLLCETGVPSSTFPFVQINSNLLLFYCKGGNPSTHWKWFHPPPFVFSFLSLLPFLHLMDRLKEWKKENHLNFISCPHHLSSHIFLNTHHSAFPSSLSWNYSSWGHVLDTSSDYFPVVVFPSVSVVEFGSFCFFTLKNHPPHKTCYLNCVSLGIFIEMLSFKPHLTLFESESAF